MKKEIKIESNKLEIADVVVIDDAKYIVVRTFNSIDKWKSGNVTTCILAEENHYHKTVYEKGAYAYDVFDKALDEIRDARDKINKEVDGLKDKQACIENICDMTFKMINDEIKNKGLKCSSK